MKVIIAVSFLWILQIINGQECAPGEEGCCDTMMPPSFIPPQDSSCWQWWDAPQSGMISEDNMPLKGCDYRACQDAVCACDAYCCDTAWDKSCRGYFQEIGKGQNNYFSDGCSAKILCCEPKKLALPEKEIDNSNSCTPGTDENCCETMIPPSFFVPVDSTCWEWWDAPADGIVPADMVLTKGCDYSPCEAAVCACDSYCCDTVWDKSCRGYEQDANGGQENYFINGCSAKMLCCELDMADAVLPAPEALPAPTAGPPDTSFQCNPDSDEECCDTMVPPSFYPPRDSTCWDWWDAPMDGILKAGEEPTKGCDYQPCQDAVCACDSYCCDTAWDRSCRGYFQEIGKGQNNYFEEGCSAKILCCELNLLDIIKEKLPVPIEENLPVPVPMPVPAAKEVPLPVPVVKEVPLPVPVVKEVPLPVPVVKEVPLPVPVVKKVPVVKQVPLPVPGPPKVIEVPLPVPGPPKVIEVPLPVPGPPKVVEVPVQVTVAPKIIPIPVPVTKPIPIPVFKPVVPEPQYIPKPEPVYITIPEPVVETVIVEVPKEVKQCICPLVEIEITSSGKSKSGGKSGKSKSGGKSGKRRRLADSYVVFGSYSDGSGSCECTCMCPSGSSISSGGKSKSGKKSKSGSRRKAIEEIEAYKRSKNNINYVTGTYAETGTSCNCGVVSSVGKSKSGGKSGKKSGGKSGNSKNKKNKYEGMFMHMLNDTFYNATRDYGY